MSAGGKRHNHLAFFCANVGSGVGLFLYFTVQREFFLFPLDGSAFGLSITTLLVFLFG